MKAILAGLLSLMLLHSASCGSEGGAGTDPCSRPNVCQSNQTCSEIDGAAVCSCSPGYDLIDGVCYFDECFGVNANCAQPSNNSSGGSNSFGDDSWELARSLGATVISLTEECEGVEDLSGEVLLGSLGAPNRTPMRNLNVDGSIASETVLALQSYYAEGAVFCFPATEYEGVLVEPRIGIVAGSIDMVSDDKRFDISAATWMWGFAKDGRLFERRLVADIPERLINNVELAEGFPDDWNYLSVNMALPGDPAVSDDMFIPGDMFDPVGTIKIRTIQDPSELQAGLPIPGTLVAEFGL